ncbi:MAG TPA: GNAT family protein [bacterium]|nr:GNAT family protein [bacterium]
MDRLLIKIPEVIGTKHLYLRCFRPGDEAWYLDMIRKNRNLLSGTDSFCETVTVEDEKEAAILIRRLALGWDAREIMNLGVFVRGSDEFIGQIVIEPVNWELPEFCIDFFWDSDHDDPEMHQEALAAGLDAVFRYLAAQRITIWCPAEDDYRAESLRQAGFQAEGRLRSNRRMSDGTLADTMVYGLIRPDRGSLTTHSP